MAKQKYLLFYDLMIEQNENDFKKFKIVHDQYSLDGSNQVQFHQLGRDILDIVRDWDRRLCSGMERGNFAGYSSKLSEKFWQRVKKDYPLIEEVGVSVSYTKVN